VLYVVF
jgi:WD40 repeat protein